MKTTESCGLSFRKAVNQYIVICDLNHLVEFVSVIFSSPFNPTSTNLVGFELHKYHKNEAHQSDTPYTYIPSVVIKGWVTHCTFSLTLFP
jgi:hypothetical protein